MRKFVKILPSVLLMTILSINLGNTSIFSPILLEPEEKINRKDLNHYVRQVYKSRSDYNQTKIQELNELPKDQPLLYPLEKSQDDSSFKKSILNRTTFYLDKESSERFKKAMKEVYNDQEKLFSRNPLENQQRTYTFDLTKDLDLCLYFLNSSNFLKGEYDFLSDFKKRKDSDTFINIYHTQFFKSGLKELINISCQLFPHVNNIKDKELRKKYVNPAMENLKHIVFNESLRLINKLPQSTIEELYRLFPKKSSIEETWENLTIDEDVKPSLANVIEQKQEVTPKVKDKENTQKISTPITSTSIIEKSKDTVSSQKTSLPLKDEVVVKEPNIKTKEEKRQEKIESRQNELDFFRSFSNYFNAEETLVPSKIKKEKPTINKDIFELLKRLEEKGAASKLTPDEAYSLIRCFGTIEQASKPTHGKAKINTFSYWLGKKRYIQDSLESEVEEEKESVLTVSVKHKKDGERFLVRKQITQLKKALEEAGIHSNKFQLK